MPVGDAALLVGNTYPVSLVTRDTLLKPRSIESLRQIAKGRRVVSFWGHPNTLAAASDLLAIDLTPSTPRPALDLGADGLPTLDGESFDRVWVLTPEYAAGYRPAAGEATPPERIRSWRVVEVTFP